MNRYQAFAVHITIAAVVLTSTLALLVFLFYPDFYFHAEGVWSATRIVIMVDLVLGPLLTLIVFKPGKKGLKFDLALIATVQISALIYGIYILYSERPAYLVFSIDRFEVAKMNKVDLSGFNNKQLAVGPFDSPMTVLLKPPSGEEKQQLIQQFMQGGKDLYLLARYYQTFADHAGVVQSQCLDQKNLFPTLEDQLILAEFLQINGGDKSDYCYLPLVGNSNIMLGVVKPQTGQVIGALHIDPWES